MRPTRYQLRYDRLKTGTTMFVGKHKTLDARRISCEQKNRIAFRGLMGAPTTLMYIGVMLLDFGCQQKFNAFETITQLISSLPAFSLLLSRFLFSLLFSSHTRGNLRVSLCASFVSPPSLFEHTHTQVLKTHTTGRGARNQAVCQHDGKCNRQCSSR